MMSLNPESVIEPLSNRFDEKLVWIPVLQLDISSVIPIWNKIALVLSELEVVIVLDEQFPNYIRHYFNKLSAGTKGLSCVSILSIAMVDSAKYLLLDDQVQKEKLMNQFPSIYSLEIFLFQSAYRHGLVSTGGEAIVYDIQDLLKNIKASKLKESLAHSSNLIKSSTATNPLTHFIILAPSHQEMVDVMISNLKDTKLSKIILFQPLFEYKYQPMTKVDIVREPLSLLKELVNYKNDHFLIQFLPLQLDSRGVERLKSCLSQFTINSSDSEDAVHIAAPLTLNSHPIAKVNFHLKIDQYPVHQKMDANGLREFIYQTNQAEFLKVPEVDVGLMMCTHKAMVILAQDGLQKMVQSPSLNKCYCLDTFTVG